LKDTEDQKVSQNLEQTTVTELDGEGYDSDKGRKISLNRLRRRRYFLIISGVLFGLLIAVGTFALIYTHDQQRILEGLTISGIDVGNLTQIEAKEVVDKEVNRLLNQTIMFNVDQHSPEATLKDLGLGLDEDLALQEAYDIGKKGTIINKVLSKISAEKGLDISFNQKWDESKLREVLNETLDEFTNPATDATFQIKNDNTMAITSDQVGLTIDYEPLIQKVKEINIYKPVSELIVDLKEHIPLITAAQLEDQKITGLLATYTTRFDPTQIARTENVRIAAKAMDMAIFKPGDTLSFNKIVGERTIEGGYKDAYIIVNGQFVPGLAGGICQVSSTLYNTGLLANLAVTQRSNHDLAISYVPLGQDATVAFPDLDLKFKNNSGGYLLLRTSTTYNTITIALYGKVKPGQEVFIANTIESITQADEQRLVDETMAQGESTLKQQGQPGYTVKSARIVKLNGEIVSSEPLNPSYYLPLPRIFAVGPS